LETSGWLYTWVGAYLCPAPANGADGHVLPSPRRGTLVARTARILGLSRTPADQQKGTPSMSGTRVFAIANQKGGVGKTTTSINLAACLADAGRRTLVIDLDPQSNTTTGLGVDAHRVGLSIYEVLVNDSVAIGDALKRDIRQNLALLPAKVDLYAADIEL